jgi:hypothetical protein
MTTSLFLEGIDLQDFSFAEHFEKTHGSVLKVNSGD